MSTATQFRISEFRYRALVEHSTDAVALFDSEGRVLYCNGASERVLGYRPDELLGRAAFDLIHNDDRATVHASLGECLKNPGRPITIRSRVRHKNGSYRLVEAVFNNMLHDPDVRAVINNYRDITQAAAAENALHKSEERFAKAFRSSPLAITMSTRADGRYVDVNDAFLQMLGYQRTDVLGHTVADLDFWAEPEDRNKMLQQLHELGRAQSVHTRFRTSTGETREGNISAELIELDGLPCILAIIQDVTEAKSLERGFRHAQKMEAVGRLAGGVAHDFCNILGVVSGYTEISQDLLVPGHPVSNHLTQIKKAAERATALTRQLLAFSRRQILHPKTLDLNAVVNNMNQMLLRMIREDVSLSFKPGASLGYVKADPGQIEQILMNLVVNARDAMPRGGKILIETTNVELDESYVDSHAPVVPGSYVMLSVSDTGCGMDEKTASLIFEPFFTTKGPGQGTGLGLSTVYGIVKQSGGYIWVYSELGNGTTFKLYFPRTAEGVEPLVGPTAEIESKRGSETILVVEDDKSLRELTVSLLESAGYKVLEAESTETAIRIAQDSKSTIDLLLTDVIMPTMSGLELSASIRTVRPGLKVLLMSGYTGDMIARYGTIDEGMTLLEKPFTRHCLLSKTHLALHN